MKKKMNNTHNIGSIFDHQQIKNREVHNINLFTHKQGTYTHRHL